MHDDLSLKQVQREWHGSWTGYFIGFALSLLLTTASFSIVAFEIFLGRPLIYSLIGLAIAQAIVQVLFFLHLGQEDKPRWESRLFFFMVLVILIIFLGTLWIMYDLDQRVMSGMNHEMVND